MRFENQNAIQDHGDWCDARGRLPGHRAAAAKQLRKKSAARRFGGSFYDRFGGALPQLLPANGVTQQQFIVDGQDNAPIDFLPTVSHEPSAAHQTVRHFTRSVHGYIRNYCLAKRRSVERQLTKIRQCSFHT